jgi:Tol biopolymer transport system component
MSLLRLHLLMTVLLCFGIGSASALSVDAPVLESRRSDGSLPGGACGGGRLSDDARYLVFYCQGTHLGSLRFFGYNTFIKDRVSGEVTRVSVDSAGQGQGRDSGGGFPSADGSQVVFTSMALLHPDTPPPLPGGPADASAPHVYLRDVRARLTHLLGRGDTGMPPPLHGTQLSDVAFGQNLVLFHASWNLIAGLPYAPTRPGQLYVRNWQTGSLDLVSATPAGGYTADGVSGGSLSRDGRYVAFNANARDLGAPLPNNDHQLFLRDRVLRTTRRISVPAAGGEFSGSYHQWEPGRFTRDGRYLALSAASDELAAGDAPGYLDAYVVDLASRRFELISKGHDGAVPDNATFDIDISGDGRYVVFFSRASNLMAVPQPSPAVYVKDRVTGEIANVSAALGALYTYDVPSVDMSDDGSAIVFTWRHAVGVPVVGGQTLVYSARVRGTPLAPPVAVPAMAHSGLMVLLVLIALAAAGRLRAQLVDP